MTKSFWVATTIIIFAGLFYWFQWRPSQIRKKCFSEVYSESTDLQWAIGKEWMYYKGFTYGWLYPYWRLNTAEATYKGCLIFNGLK